MPLNQAEMDFVTNHNYELSNFDRPCPAHKALRSLGLEFAAMYQKFRPFSVPLAGAGTSRRSGRTFPFLGRTDLPLVLYSPLADPGSLQCPLPGTLS